MSNTGNNMSKGVPEAKAAMDQMKYEVANEIGVPLKQGYNGDLTSAQNGYVGGYMVKNVTPERHSRFIRNLRQNGKTEFEVNYTYGAYL